MPSIPYKQIIICVVLISSGNARCNQEIKIGGTYITVAMVNTTILPTCFTCLNTSNMPAPSPTSFSVQTSSKGQFTLIPLNDDVTQIGHQLFVTNFTSVPQLMDGRANFFECIDFNSQRFLRTVTTLSKNSDPLCEQKNLSFFFIHTHPRIPNLLSPYLSSHPLCFKDPIKLEFLDEVDDFYVEGSTVEVVCFNRNIVPFLGYTFWFDDANMQVGTGGNLRLGNVSRSQAGQYTCRVGLFDQTLRVEIPSLSFTLVIHCKLNSICV